MAAATYDADQLADRLGVCKRSLYESVRQGTCPIPPIKIGRRLVWPKATVDRLLGIDTELPEPSAP